MNPLCVLYEPSTCVVLVCYSVFQSVSEDAEISSLQQQAVSNPLPVRASLMDQLRTEEFDVLVVGGGATGCGVALDAQSRGEWLDRNFFHWH